MTTKIIFGYWSTWSCHREGKGKFAPSNINPFLCTHLAYALFGIENGIIKSLDQHLDTSLDQISKFVALKQVNQNLKVLASVGGWNEGSEKYSVMASSTETRATFINSILKFLQVHRFDGLDLIWQYPAQRGGKAEDRENYVILLKELQAAFKPHDLLLSVAVAASPLLVCETYNIAQISHYVDFINVMAFDYFTPWGDIFGHNAPLYGGRHSVYASINYWLENGAAPWKLVLGIPFFGHTYKMPATSDIFPGATSAGAGVSRPYTNEAGYVGYNEICESFDKWTHLWDASARVPYAYNSNEWLSYDNPQSIEEKIKFIKQKNLLGAMVWSIDLDDFHGVSGQSNPLLQVINKALLQ